MAASSVISGQVPCTAADPNVPAKARPVAADIAGKLLARTENGVIEILIELLMEMRAVRMAKEIDLGMNMGELIEMAQSTNQESMR